MTDRIPLDAMTSDQLDALYEQLEAAEATEAQRQLATAREALASATTRAARAEAAIARVRKAISVRLADDECGEWERHGYHSALADVRRALDDGEESTPAWDTPVGRQRLAEWINSGVAFPPAPSAATQATEATEPDDTCRPVDIDGETIRVHGCGEMSDEARAALAEVIRAAKRKMEAERDPAATEATGLREQLLDAITYEMHSGKGPLAVIPRIADAVLAALSAHLDIADAEAWCKTCRRVWEGKTHRCESDAEQRADQLATLLAVILAEFRIHPGTRTATAHVETETLNRWRATLDQHQEQPHA